MVFNGNGKGKLKHLDAKNIIFDAKPVNLTGSTKVPDVFTKDGKHLIIKNRKNL